MDRVRHNPSIADKRDNELPNRVFDYCVGWLTVDPSATIAYWIIVAAAAVLGVTLPELLEDPDGTAEVAAVAGGARSGRSDLFALGWAKSIGGLDALKMRATANATAIWNFCAARDWIDNLAVNPATRSNTSVCLKFTDPRITDGAAFAKAVAKRLDAEGIALDIGAYRDAPAGLRIWCGATIETSDIEAMLPWLDWAYGEVRQS